MKISIFKKVITLIVVSIFASASLFADDVRYNDSWGNQGFNLTVAEKSNVNIIHSVSMFSFNTVSVNGVDMQSISMPGVFLPSDAGTPDLPGESRFIAVPVGATAKLNIKSMRTETFQNIEIAPAPVIPLDGDDSPLVYEKDLSVYGQDAMFPANPVKLSEPMKIRGVDVVMLGITPFQYNPVSKELVVLRDLDIEIVFEGGNGEFGDTRFRSRWWDPILHNNVLNSQSLPEVNYDGARELNSDDDEYEYVIITLNDPDFLDYANQIAEFRNKQGIETGVFTVDDVGGNSVAAIESFINNAYNNWTPALSAVLLLGDYGAGTSGIISHMFSHPAGYPDFASDNKYADVSGNHLPDVILARITANNATELETMVSKFIDYETNPPTDPDFYNHPITALGWQTERWFQICSETVGGYLKNVLGMDPVRINAIYSGSPGSVWSTATNTSTVVNYFGPNGQGYIPATPSSMGGWSGGTSTGVINAINAGSFLLQHRDHGSYTGWGEPAFQSYHINSLTNVDNKLPFIMSINCQTGAFHRPQECFTEKFHRHTYNGENSGALGLLAATEVSYSFVNDTYVWGVFDNMFPDFMPDETTQFPVDYAMPAFGNGGGKHFLFASSWPYNTSNKQITYQLFHHHGGAYLTLYTAVPQDLTVMHDGMIPFGANTFTISATPGALICLYYDGEIISTATGGFGQISMAIPSNLPMGSDVTLTVTKQNYFRHEETIPVGDALSAAFEADATSICPEGLVNFTDLSTGDPVEWLWTFEGGDPATSTEQNPTEILYNTAGSYDVTLEVTSASSTDTYTMEDYITVMDNLSVMAEVYATSEDICEGDEVTFNVEVDNGGSEPTFQWKLNGIDVGDGTDVYVTSELADMDIVECEVTSSLECTIQNPVMSNTITMIVNEIMPVAVIVETETTSVCIGEEVIFTAEAVNGGDSPVYQWKVNGNNVGDNSETFTTTTLADGDIVSCELTSNANCVENNPAMSDDINMTVLEELPAEVSIETTVAEICAGDEVTFTASPVNGGDEPDYQWKINGVDVGDNSPTFTTTDIMENAVVTCEMTSSFSCAINNPAMSNEVNMTVEAYPVEMEIPNGPNYVDLYETTSTTYATTEDPNATSYTWVITPEEAYINMNDDMYNLTVEWNAEYTGQANISVFGTNDCGDGPTSPTLEVSVENTFGIGENELNIGVSVFPNPNNGTFTVKLSSENNEDVRMQIRSIIGEIVYSERELSVNGEFVKVIDLSNFAEGIYFLIIENNNSVLTEKIVIQK